ncbi:unnamed protein product, partial [Hymenolepis diminuta]
FQKCPVVPQGHIFRLDNFLSCKLPNTIEANLSPSCGQNTKRRDSNEFLKSKRLCTSRESFTDISKSVLYQDSCNSA